jgi:nucleotidyltransferase substrate binding protein (TIGR01987 family)
MSEDKLDINPLQNAVSSLERALNVIFKKEQMENPDIDELETIRAGVIQNFEFTYELCWKYMKRWLEFNFDRESVNGITRLELFRLAAENKLIADVEQWFQFHKARNKTSHEYNGIVAVDVYQSARTFLPHAKDFVSRLERRL